MRIEVNAACNVRTNEGAQPWPANPRARVDVTVPSFRASLNPDEAHMLGVDLIEAANVADQHRARIEAESFHRNPRPTYAQLLEYVRSVARMITPDESQELTDDDNAMTLGELIVSARTITGEPVTCEFINPTEPTTTKEPRA